MKDSSVGNTKTITPNSVHWLSQALEEYSKRGRILFEQRVHPGRAAPELQTRGSLAAMQACREGRASLNFREVWLLVCKPTPLQNQTGYSVHIHEEGEEQYQRLYVGAAQSLKRQFVTFAQGNAVSMMSVQLPPNGNTALCHSCCLVQSFQEIPLLGTSTCSGSIRNWLEWERDQQAQMLSRMH